MLNICVCVCPLVVNNVLPNPINCVYFTYILTVRLKNKMNNIKSLVLHNWVLGSSGLPLLLVYS